MAEIIQTFFTYAGLTLFLGGLIFCFVAPAFRYGVFCSVLGNLFFVTAIVFPKQMVQFVETHELAPYFTSVDILALKEKAVITGIILMCVLWIVRWFKHLTIEGFFIFLFPSLARPVVKEEKKKKNKKSKKKGKSEEASLAENAAGAETELSESFESDASAETQTKSQDDAGGELSQNMDTSGKNSEKLYDDAIEDNGERNQDQQKFAKEEDLPVIRVRG